MKKKIMIHCALMFVVATCVSLSSMVKPVTKQEFQKGIHASAHEILDNVLSSNDYEYLFEAIRDIETEEELNIVASVINARAEDIGKFNKNKIDNVIHATREEIRKLSQLPHAVKKAENLGKALRSLAQQK